MFTLGTSCSSLQDDVSQRRTPEAGHLLHAKQKNKEKDVLTLGPAPSLSSVFYLSLLSHTSRHTPNTAFRHLPPNSARFDYATEGALFISAQLSSDAVSALRKVRVLIWL